MKINNMKTTCIKDYIKDREDDWPDWANGRMEYRWEDVIEGVFKYDDITDIPVLFNERWHPTFSMVYYLFSVAAHMQALAGGNDPAPIKPLSPASISRVSEIVPILRGGVGALKLLYDKPCKSCNKKDCLDGGRAELRRLLERYADKLVIYV